MKKNIAVAALLVFVATLAARAQNLESVLNSMDKAAADFRTAQTDFVWDQYQKVVDEHDLQKGTMYFRRQGSDVQMAADITTPDKKYVLFSGGMVSVYVPKAGQVTEYLAGKNKADFETFLVLGFGGRGHDLAKSFDVKYAGMEQVQGVNVQQLFNERSGDYRLAKYNNIKLNEKLSNDVFKLKTSGKVTYVKPNS
jgi:outer membrane lipoprotein-sorting protein